MDVEKLKQYLAPNILEPGGGQQGLLIDFVVTIWVALLLLLSRIIAERTLLPILRSLIEWLQPTGSSLPPHKLALKSFSIFDNLWIATFSGSLVAFAWWVTVTDNGGCTPWKTWDCFGKWPNHHNNWGQRWFMLLSFAYYLYELIGTSLGIGTRLKTDMIAHHVVSMALTLIAYKVNLVRMSVMWQALFDISNPILHCAKGLHSLSLAKLDGLKWFMFNLFALSFFVCRVLMGPYSILWPSFTTAVEWLPMSYCYTCWGLQVFVYVLQLVWFYKIVQIATKGEKEADKTD